MQNEIARPLPLTLDGLDAEWMTRALRTRAPGVTCEVAEIVDVVPGTCTKVRLRLQVDQVGKDAGIPEYVMLKGGFESHSRPMSHVHESEVRGYRDVLPVLKLPSPICYFADYEPASLQGIVIMEDLTKIGVEFCSALRPHSFEQVKRRLTALARFHAQTWGSADFAEGRQWGEMREGITFLRIYMQQYLDKPEEWQRFVESPRGAATSVRLHDLDRMNSSFDKLVRFAKSLPHCVVHGDTHLGNLYIYADGTPGFFDSLPGKGPALNEVAYHMTCALDTADRRRWEGALVQHYLDELTANGVDAPGFDDAMEQFAVFLFTGHIIFMVNESFYQPEAINTAYTARFSAAMLDHGTLDLIEAIDRRLAAQSHTGSWEAAA